MYALHHNMHCMLHNIHNVILCTHNILWCNTKHMHAWFTVTHNMCYVKHNTLTHHDDVACNIYAIHTIGMLPYMNESLTNRYYLSN